MTNRSTEEVPVSTCHGSLLRKHALVFGTLVVGTLLVSGLIDIYFTYSEHKAALIAVQREKADASARLIEQYIRDIEQRIAFTTSPKPGVDPLDHRRAELEALSQVPAITDIALLDASGNDHFHISQLASSKTQEPQSWREIAAQVKSGKPYRGPVYFRYGAEPYMRIAMMVGTKEAGITVADVGLEFLLEGIRHITVGKAGYAYVVDGTGQLIAHPNLNLVLKKNDLSTLPQVKAALANTTEQRVFLEGRDLSGASVFAAYDVIPHLGWYVFVEQPQKEAFAPLYASALRAGALLLTGLVLALVAAVALVRRMVRPIQALRKGAMLIGSGNLNHRIEVHTGDELEELAGQFNRMASQLQASYASLEEKVRERTRELERANRELAEVSVTDSLTGLRNRRFVQQMLDADIALVLRRYNDFLSRVGTVPQPSMDLVFFMVDVDHFKAVNDEYGHAAGDTVLAQVPMRLRDIFRESDYLVRWGGEEFLVVARATERAEANRLAERICASIARQPFRLDDGTDLHLTCSVGYACFPFIPMRPQLLHWTQVAELADRALYLSKRNGRNTWNGVVATDKINDAGLFERLVQDLDKMAATGDVRIVSGKADREAAMA